MRWIPRLLLAGTLVACACSAPPAAPAPAVTAPTSPAGPPTASAATSPSRSPSVVASPSPGSQAQTAVDAALRDAATHLGVSQADLKVEQVEARQWSDASLGCPRPGVLYAQVVTPGYLIVVTGGARQLEYHSDERGRVVLCAEQ